MTINIVKYLDQVMAITEQELRSYFSDKDNTIVNKEKIKISVRDKDIFCLVYLLQQDKKEGVKYELYDEVRDAKEFINVFNLQRPEDLQHISRSDLWIRYLAEKVELTYVIKNY